jgi:hypothetical protein
MDVQIRLKDPQRHKAKLLEFLKKKEKKMVKFFIID